MIGGYFNQGSGLGNQLHRYVATRVRATDLGVDHSMIYVPDGSGKPEGFKGESFMDISWGLPARKECDKIWVEKKVVVDGVDIRGYDPEFNFVPDNTIIEGEFQDERYWQKYESDVHEWLEVEPLHVPVSVCVIGFRGGEYSAYPDLYLTKDYWDKAIEIMKVKNPKMRFEVHTDDPERAKEFFPDYECIHDIGINWRSMRFAKYAIIANSSFYILPRWLSKGVTISPRYWARRNTKVWALPQNYYGRFLYI